MQLVPKKLVYSWLLLALSVIGVSPVFATIPHIDASESTKVLHIQQWKSKQGVEVYFVRSTPLPMLDIVVTFHAGSSFDKQAYGLASFVSSMLGEGTTKYSADEIARRFDSHGAVFSSNAGLDKAIVAMRSLSAPKYLKPNVQLFKNILSQSNFPEKSFSRVKNQIRVAIAQGQQNPMTVARNAFYKALYGSQPYGHAVIGQTDTVKNIQRQQLQAFYKRYYVRANAQIIMVGNLSGQQAHRLADKLLAGLPQGEGVVPIAAPKILASVHKKISFPAKQTTIFIGQYGLGYGPRQANMPLPKSFYPLLVGNHVLGGMAMSSILFRQVRGERGLAYFAQSSFLPLYRQGPFVAVMQTRNAKAQTSLEVATNAINQFIQQGPTKVQLRLAKQNLLGARLMALSTNAGIVGAVTNYAFYHLPTDYFDQVDKNINAVSSPQIKQYFQSTLSPNHWTVIEVGGPKK